MLKRIANSGAIPSSETATWNNAVTTSNQTFLVAGTSASVIGGGAATDAAATTVASGGLLSEGTVPIILLGTGTAVVGTWVAANASKNLAEQKGLIRDKNAPPGTYDNKRPQKEKNRVVDQKPGEAALNQSDGINARQASLNKSKPTGAREQNTIRDTKKSTNNLKNVNKNIKTSKDADNLY